MFAESKLGLAINQHKSVIALFKSRHVDVGDTCKDWKTVTDMNEVISTVLHDELIEMIKSGDHPITVVADGTTTKISNHYFMSVLFQFWDGSKVQMKFYRLIHLPGSMDGSAEPQMKALVQKFEDDGILEHIQKNIVGNELLTKKYKLILERFSSIQWDFVT